MADLEFKLLDEASFDAIPAPAAPGTRCQTCDYWERLDGTRSAPVNDAPDSAARAGLKRSRLLPAQLAAGANAMLAYRVGGTDRIAVGFAQFGPLSAYPRAQSIRDRYPNLPESPSPWIITCLQVVPRADAATRATDGAALLDAVCGELDRRGITAVEAYPEAAPDAWLPSPGPAAIYRAASFELAAGDDRFPVYRRELSGETDPTAWADLLRAARPDEGDDWPLPLPPTPNADDFFRLPPERPKRPNPFGDD